MASASDANSATTVLSPGYDPVGHQDRVALRVANVQTDVGVTPNIIYGDLGITGSISATNPSVGTDGSAIPSSSTLIGASDGTNLQQLLVESASNRNLRTGIYSGANEATVTGANALKVDGSAVTQPVSGTVNNNPTMPAGVGLIFKPVKHVAVTAGTPITLWTPGRGKKFRLMGYRLGASSSTTVPNMLLEDSATEFLRIPQAQTQNYTPVADQLGPIGYLSTAANNLLKLDIANGDSPSNIDGYVYGYEE